MGGTKNPLKFMRQDLLALTTDDLAVLSNRGLVKRALKDLDEGSLSYEAVEDLHGNVCLRWSDEVECILPLEEELSDRHCTCAATTICRHLIRSVIAYQRTTNSQSQVDTKSIAWNPGEISDTELAKYFNKATLTRTRQSFESGHIIELIKSSKPIARIHTLAYTVRFLVSGDIRYTYCDCSDAPCRHVLFAVWAFRLLPPDRECGIISTMKPVSITG